MTKVRCPASPQGLIEMAVVEVGGRAEAATILQCTEKWLYNASNPDLVGTAHEAKITLDHVRALTRAGATVFAHDLARLLNMELVPAGSAGGPDPHELMAKLSSLMTETGEALTRGGMAAADGTICARDISDVRKEVNDVVRAAYALLQLFDRKDR